MNRFLSVVLFVVLVGVAPSCTLTPEKHIDYNTMVSGVDGKRKVTIRRMWSLTTRKNQLSLEGNAPLELGGMLVVGDTLFFGNLLGQFSAVDRFTGRKLWSTELPDGIESKPLLEESVIYVGSTSGWFYALSVHGGRTLWKVNLHSEVLGQPAFWEGRVIAHTSNGRIVAMDASTGKWMWEVKRPQIKDKSIRGVSSPVVEDNKIYVGSIDGYLLALNAHDGTKLWEKNITPAIRFTDVDTTPLLLANKIIISAYDGKTYALRKRDGAIMWSYIHGSAFTPTVVGEKVIVSTQRSTVDAIHVNTGKLIWSAAFDTRHGVATGVGVDSGLVAFGTTAGRSYVVALDDGHFVWSFRPGAGIGSHPIFKSSKFYVLSNYGNLYAFNVQ